MAKKRSITFDYLKLFAIYLVLWGHCIQQLRSYDNPMDSVYLIIYSFHMPLFMMVSGYFSLSSLDLPLGMFVKKKAVQLLLPCVTWGLIAYIVRKNLDSPKLSTTTDIIDYAINAFWFLKSLFMCYVLAYIFKRCRTSLMKLNGWPSQCLSGTVLLLTLTISQMACFNDYRLWYMYPCFLLGMMLRRRPNYLSLASCFWFPIGIVFLAMLVMWNGKIFSTNSLFIIILKNIVAGNFSDYQAIELGGFNLYKLVIGFVGSITFIGLFHHLFQECKDSSTFLCRMGQYTMEVYILQVIILENIIRSHVSLDNMGVLCYDFIFTPMMAFAVLFVCILITKLTYLVAKDCAILRTILWGK